jgi:uncharacterized protein YegP (UPF0339 family)
MPECRGSRRLVYCPTTAVTLWHCLCAVLILSLGYLSTLSLYLRWKFTGSKKVYISKSSVTNGIELKETFCRVYISQSSVTNGIELKETFCSVFDLLI